MNKPWRLAILGAPGAGKGTQAKRLCQRLNIAHLSTGDILRASLAQGGKTGLEAKKYVEAGELVPDQVIVAMIHEKLVGPDCVNGYLLDGFPRTDAQADSLDALLEKLGYGLDRVIVLDVPEEALIQRLAGRRICRKCGASYHVVFSPPAKKDKCDACSGQLYQRPDDSEETVRNRLKVYERQTLSLIDRYEKSGLILRIDGDAVADQVFDRMMVKLEGISS